MKFIAGYTDRGRLEIHNVKLSGNFEVIFDVDFTNSSPVVALGSDTGEQILVGFPGSRIAFGNTTKEWKDSGWQGDENINECKIESTVKWLSSL